MCVCLIVYIRMCVGSQTGIPSPNVDDSFMWFGSSEHYQSVCRETHTASFLQTHRHKQSIYQYQQSSYDFTFDGKQHRQTHACQNSVAGSALDQGSCKDILVA